MTSKCCKYVKIKEDNWSYHNVHQQDVEISNHQNTSVEKKYFDSYFLIGQRLFAVENDLFVARTFR
jgi:coproporphyrinogen III oxidase